MTSVTDLFTHADVPYAGVVRWNESVPLDSPGVYVVSTSADADERIGLRDCPLDLDAIDKLLRARPEATVDSVPATLARLADRLRAMWPADEPVVYIGLAGTSTARRVDQFYRTPIGARTPHAGGWPVKMLRAQSLWVHYGPTVDSNTAESAMVRRFIANLPVSTTHALIDPETPLPFANLTIPAGRRKAHGLRGVKAAKSNARQRDEGAAPPTPTPARDDASVLRSPSELGVVRHTQIVTATDLGRGQLRVPRSTKSILPMTKAHIEVELGGQIFTASWDPRTDRERERSGVIRVGRAALADRITAGGACRIETTPTGYRIF